MRLSDISDPAAVEAALKEFDQLGRDTFLRKYGFRKARTYFLERGGKLYDSKAVAAAANGFQYPERGPLRNQDFNGGDATVRGKLEELGFDVQLGEVETNIGFRDVMEQVLDLQPSWTWANSPEMKLRGQLIRSVGPRALGKLLPDQVQLSFLPAIEGRDGTGRKTRVP